MSFSTAQEQYINEMVLNAYNQGYKFYLAYTNTRISNMTNQEHDLTLVFSQEPIINRNYEFTVSSGYFMEIRTGNASSSNTYERIVVEDIITSRTFRIDSYEHISTNAANSIYMNHLAEIGYNHANNISFNLDLTYAYALLGLLSLLFVTNFIKSIFRYGD